MKKVFFVMMCFCFLGAAFAQQADNQRVIEMTKQDFLDKVFDYTAPNATFKGNTPVIVDFYATWCRPCKMIEPHLNTLANDYKGKIVIYRVNVDKEKGIARDLEVRSIPTLYFFPKEGEPTIMVGYHEFDEIKQLIDNELLKK